MRSAAPGDIEFYSEFLESNRFPGESQSGLLRDYIAQKYAGRSIDVVVAGGSAPRDFLFKYRTELFPHSPIVFTATDNASTADLMSGAGATGIVFVNTYRKTLDLALRVHPGTKQVFIISGSIGDNNSFERMARSQLNGYESKAAVTYLTDLSLRELMVRVKNLPKHSVVLYVWQQARNDQGKLLESRDVLNLIAPSTPVPLYGMSFANVGRGIVGGYVWTMEANAARLAAMTLKVAYGARASDIPVESAPDTPMFDWRQLQQWGIREDRLPENSVIRFRALTLWQQFKWRIIAAIAIIAFQALLIFALLIQRRRALRNAAALDRAQRVLRESEERFRNMANTAPVMIAISDADRQATFFNNGWLDFTGRTMEQELGQGWMAGVHPDDLDACLAGLRASFEARSRCHMEYRLRRADGQYRSIICTGVPRFESDGAFAGYIATLTDITELRQRQNEALANQKLESLGVLVSGIAHDFNNLLGGILAESELLLSDLAGASPTRAGVENIKVVSIRASEIVRQLMVYARQERMVFEAVDLAELVREMLQLIMASITKRAALKIDVPERVPPIRANAAQIRQVLMNLITNASDALRDKGGDIHVVVKQVHEQGESSVGAPQLPSPHCLQLEVRDSGSGMTDEIQARIFDPFFTTKGAGRGLGLAAVQGIILSHGGTIKVVSKLGEGSSFEILLPCFGQPVQVSSEIAKADSSSGGEGSTGTVLIVDDEDTLRVSVGKMLRRRGFFVFEAGDGATGLHLFQIHAAELDVILLDLTLPEMSGAEVLGELRRMRPDIKVILTTAYGRDRAFAEVCEQESIFYLRKPYHINDLIALLNICLKKPDSKESVQARVFAAPQSENCPK